MIARANRIALVFWLAAYCVLTLGERRVIQHYYPSSDEIVLLTSSAAPFHPDPAEWIRSGFSRYFMAYPDWYAPHFSFLRPAWNATYYIDSLFFGRNWGYYLLGNYFLYALMAALVVWIGLAQLSLTKTKALLAGLTILVCPAFISQTFFYPCFASDILTSVLVIAGFIALRARRCAWCWIALLLAVFTKETALLVPAAAALYILLTINFGPARHRWRLAAAMLLPSLLWSGVRMLVFGPVSQVYVAAPLTGIVATLRTVAKGFAHWPTGVVLRGSVVSLALGAGVNLLFWLAAVVCLWRYLASGKSPPDHSAEWNVALQLGLFAGATSSLLIVVSAQNRLGACFYPWFVLLIFYCWQRRYLPPLRLAGALCLVSIAAGGIWQKREVFTADKERMVRRSEMSRRFVQAVASSRAGVIFLVDDVVSGADTEEAVRQFSGTGARLIKLSNLDLIDGEPAALMDDDVRNCASTPTVGFRRESDRRFSITSSVNRRGVFHNFDDAALDWVCSRSRDAKVTRVEKPYSFRYSREDLQRVEARMQNPDVSADPIPMTVEVEGPLEHAEILIPDLCQGSFRTVSLAH